MWSVIERGRASRGGFTLVELLAVVSIIILVMGVLLVSYREVTKSAESAASRAALTTISTGIESFKTEFGFLPPLVRDNPLGSSGIVGPLDTHASNDERVPTGFYLDGRMNEEDDYDVLFGRTFSAEEHHFSVYSLSYYLVGALPGAFSDDRALDGVEGPGFFPPDRTGGWEISANIDPGDPSDPLRETLELSRYDSFVSFDGEGLKIQRTDGAPDDDLREYRLELAGGDGVPIRYYRWLPGEYSGGQYSELIDNRLEFDLRQLNVPDVFGDPVNDEMNDWWADPSHDEDLEALSPAKDVNELRGARYAVVSAGPDGVFGDEITVNGDAGSMSEADGFRVLSVASGIDESRLRSDAGQLLRVLREARADNVYVVGKP